MFGSDAYADELLRRLGRAVRPSLIRARISIADARRSAKPSSDVAWRLTGVVGVEDKAPIVRSAERRRGIPLVRPPRAVRTSRRRRRLRRAVPSFLLRLGRPRRSAVQSRDVRNRLTRTGIQPARRRASAARVNRRRGASDASDARRRRATLAPRRVVAARRRRVRASAPPSVRRSTRPRTCSRRRAPRECQPAPERAAPHVRTRHRYIHYPLYQTHNDIYHRMMHRSMSAVHDKRARMTSRLSIVIPASTTARARRTLARAPSSARSRARSRVRSIHRIDATARDDHVDDARDVRANARERRRAMGTSAKRDGTSRDDARCACARSAAVNRADERRRGDERDAGAQDVDAGDRRDGNARETGGAPSPGRGLRRAVLGATATKPGGFLAGLGRDDGERGSDEARDAAAGVRGGAHGD